MKKLFFILFFIAVIPVAIADKCEVTSHKEICSEIINAGLSDLEEDYLISDIISNSKFYPDFQLVNNWNKQSPLNTPPDGIQKYSKGFIDDAWVKILAVMPSVLLNNTLLINNSGELLIGSDYIVNIPSYTEAGDCKTIRVLEQNSDQVNIYFNQIYEGTGKDIDYSVNYIDKTDLVIKADYIVTVRTIISHYKKKEFCTKKNCVTKCVYHSTENKIDELIIDDVVIAQIHNPELQAEFKIKDKYLNTTKANLTFSEFANLELTFDNSSLQEHHYSFSIVQNLSPLRVLILKTEQYKSNKAENLAFTGNDNYEVILKNTNNCKIIISSFFDNKSVDCDLNFVQFNVNISTDKLIYAENEEINLQIEPQQNYIVKYADKEFATDGNIKLKDNKKHNKITIVYNDKEFEKLIHVKNEEPLNILFSVGVFAGTNIIFLGLVKKYWGATL